MPHSNEGSEFDDLEWPNMEYTNYIPLKKLGFRIRLIWVVKYTIVRNIYDPAKLGDHD